MTGSKSVCPTIYDVAREAGVSAGTVSSICAQGRWTANYSPATIQKVKNAARLLGYKPSRAARGTSKGCTLSASLLISPRTSHNFTPYIGEFYYGISEVLDAKDYHVTLDRTFSEEIFGRFPRETDGVIVHADADVKYHPDRNWPEDFPVVRLNAARALETDCVDPDDAEGVRKLVSRLLGCGYRHFVYVDLEEHGLHPSFDIRREGVLNGAKEGGGKSEIVVETSADIGEMLGRIRPGGKTVFVAYSSLQAMSVFYVAAKRHLEVPKDFGLASCDRDTLQEGIKIGPNVSGLYFDPSELGRRAGRMLLQKIENGNAPVPSELVPEVYVPGNTLAGEG